MASSFNNRHWPSLFRSKHAAEPWQQAQPDIGSSPPSLLSAGGSTAAAARCLKHPLSGGVERSPDPKPRWNPKPEQIRILEAIFNSGMINPPRDEIPRIRMRLQEYGHVADANVFYWFQNRKARSKNKLRTATAASGRLGLGLARARAAAAPPPPVVVTPPPQTLIEHHQLQLLASSAPAQAAAAPTCSSSSSSDRSSGSSKPAAVPPQATSATAMDLLGPLAAACPQQMYYHGHPVAPPPASAPPAAHKALDDLVAASDDEPVFHPPPLPQAYCLSAAEVAAVLGAGGGGQYMHVPAQQQPPAAFLGLCNDLTTAEPPTVAGHRTCAWGTAGLAQFWLAGGGGADHHQQQLGRSNTTAASNNGAREVAHEEDAMKLGLLHYGFGASTSMETAASAAAPLAASPAVAAVAVASVAATAAAGLTGLTASTNGVVANYDLLQGLVVPGAGAGGAPAVVSSAAPTAAAQEGFAALCITDTVTGKSVAHTVAAARLDVRAQFGEAALVLRGVGVGDRGLDLEPVPVDASGCTVEPLQHGAFYYVLV